MKRITAVLLLLAMAAALLCSCAESGNDAYVATGDAILMEGEDPAEDPLVDESETLELAYYPDRSMNPLIGNNITNRVLFSLIYQGLFAVDSSNNTTPILCARYSVSSGNRVWTIYLENSATFSDGSRVTVDDVLATYEAAQNSSYYKGRFTHISSIEATEDGGICFTLDTAYENLALLLDIPIVRAEDVEADHPLGSGPYRFVEGINGAYLERVADWWSNVRVSTTAPSISLLEATDQAQVRDEFEFGDLDLAIANPMSDSFAEYRCDYELWDCENGVMLYLCCNVLYSEYFKNTDVLQKAMTYAIDREYINETYYRGLAQPSTLAVSPGSPYYASGLASKYEYDALKFVDSISDFQVPKDEQLNNKKLKLLVNSSDSARLRTARYIAEALTEFGIPCGTLECSAENYELVLRANNWDMYIGQTKLSATQDLSEFFRPWGNLSWGGIQNDTIYTMVKESLANDGNYYNLCKMIADDGRLIPILFGNLTVYAGRGRLLDLSPSRDNVFYYTMGKTMEGTKISQ